MFEIQRGTSLIPLETVQGRQGREAQRQAGGQDLGSSWSLPSLNFFGALSFYYMRRRKDPEHICGSQIF